MTTQAMIGHNTLFKRDTGGGVYATIAEVTNVTPPDPQRDTVDATHMESTDRWRDHISGLRDGGEVTVEMNFIPGAAGFTGLYADFNSDAPVSYKIVFPNATEWTFNAFITGFGPESPLEDKMTLAPTFKITGKPVLA